MSAAEHDASACETRERDLADLPERIVFYDGVCGFCDGVVQTLLARDERARFCFAPLQGDTAERLRRALPGAFPRSIDTFVYVEGAPHSPQVHVRSRAALAVAAQLGMAPRTVALLRLLPTPLLDLAYRAFARLRYRIFGKLDACRVPTPAERARFLD